MWKYCFVVSVLTVTVYGAQNNAASAANPGGYYHYPAPPRTQQFIAPAPKPIQYPQSPAFSFNGQQQQPKQPNYQQYQQQQQQLQLQQQQQQHQQQQQSRSAYFNQPTGYNYYATSSSSTPVSPNQFSNSVISQQFASPSLENAAFSMALTNQGYKTVAGTLASPSNSIALKAAPAATTSAAVSAQLALLSATPSSSGNSLNVKLPLPFNITPLNIAPLPLQAGAPYAKLPQGVTSYGTIYPQRRRR